MSTSPVPRGKLHYRQPEVAADYIARFKKPFERWRSGRELAIFEQLIHRVAPLNLSADVATGTGRALPVITRYSDQCVGLDISEEMLGHISNQDLVIADAERLPLRDNSFDLVSALRLFHHMPTEYRRRILIEMSRVSSRYLIVTYSHRRRTAAIKEFLRKCAGLRAPSSYLVSEADFTSDLHLAGLRVVCRKNLGPQLSSCFYLLEKTS